MRREGELDAGAKPRARPHSLRLAARRSAFLALVGLTVAITARILFDMVQANGTSALELVICAVTILLLVPITMSFWMALLGFLVQLRGRDPLALDTRSHGDESLPLGVRTAIVFPVYEEDPARVLAGLAATRASLERTGHLDEFEFFVLSDTMNPERWIEEELALERFRRETACTVHYRHRPRNTAKKAGNIADFCLNEGELFRYMIVFDADSVMSGDTLVRLVRVMERHPKVGIVQAPAEPVNRRTLFGRIQQFSARVYGPIWGAGLAYLQSGEGNYYGHNAILRIAPFREHCQLPVLPGKAPLGGFVLSHDFVEAALMRRAGFSVHFATDLGGSYEEPPPTLLDYAVRDRRWAQGNLQHARLIGMSGLHPVSRAHLAMGIMAYAAAPLWLLLLLLCTIEALRGYFKPHEYFASEGSLFPIWEVSIELQATVLFAIVMALLFLPRILALVEALRVRTRRASFGGGAKLVLSALGETALSTLLAPTLAFFQTQAVISILMGRNSGWRVQERGDEGTTLAQALRRHAVPTLIGIVWALALWLYARELFWWSLPVVAGLVLSVPISIWSSRASSGERARRRRLFLTPEEVTPHPLLVRLAEEARRLSSQRVTLGGRGALESVLADPGVRATHLSFAPESEERDALTQHALEGLVLKCRLHGPAALSDEEQREVLLSPSAVSSLAAAQDASALAGGVEGRAPLIPRSSSAAAQPEASRPPSATDALL